MCNCVHTAVYRFHSSIYIATKRHTQATLFSNCKDMRTLLICFHAKHPSYYMVICPVAICIKCCNFYCIVVPSLQQQLCIGRCGQVDSIINVTVPNSVIIPCGDLLSSTPSSSSTVDYCNATNGINVPLATGVVTLYNLTTVEPSHDNNIIYCTNSQAILCYRLSVFCKKYHII